ncbi:MAG: peptidase M64 [Deferribacteres bacterium]|nr:peptidase M64 [candidate division KSB1 bacterium]MCB9501505.1 peptidase M64 [Deferribacteres bacterium]
MVTSAIIHASEPQTMRVDYYHTGDALTEIFSLHQVVVEPLPWPGNLARTTDETNRGLYLFEIVEPITNKVLFSRGYASIFGEWQHTGEATRMHRTFHESVRFPKPEKPVRLRISKRDDANRFAAIWSLMIDPADMLVVRKLPPLDAKVMKVMNNGPSTKKVDVLILGDGFTVEEMSEFERHCNELTKEMMAVEPFKTHKNDFNFWAINVPAPESGTNRPSNGTFRWSRIGATYDAFRSERYVLAFDNQRMREIAQYAPYEFLIILTNSETYGGGGIFGLYTTVAAKNEWRSYLMVHEFGHHFAALADEYYTSPVAYNDAESSRPEPWEPNVTALHNARHLKWNHLVDSNTDLPTPWPKSTFEAFQKTNQAKRKQLRAENRPESEMSALFRREQAFSDSLFATSKYHNSIGAFEGANYEATGFYRPAMNCIMFTRHTEFCKVCQEGIVDIINLYVD